MLFSLLNFFKSSCYFAGNFMFCESDFAIGVKDAWSLDLGRLALGLAVGLIVYVVSFIKTFFYSMDMHM